MFRPVFFRASSLVFFGGMRIRISDYAGRALCGFGGFVRGARPMYEVRCAGSGNSDLIDPAVNIAV